MKDLLINPETRQQLDLYVKTPSQTLLLVGRRGSGKLTLAINMAAQVLGLQADKLQDHPYFKLLEAGDKNSIGIDDIRQLQHFLSLKVPRAEEINRAVIVDGAHLLTVEAQNAFLKTLEEPPEGTIIILTASHRHKLLPTVVSRAQIVAVRQPDHKFAVEYFQKQRFKISEIEKARAISGGLPGLMSQLLQQADHPLQPAIIEARELLNQTAYERLLKVDSLAKQKQLTEDVLFILQQMAHVSLLTATDQSANKWQAVLDASHQASQALAANAQTKLVLTKLMTSF